MNSTTRVRGSFDRAASTGPPLSAWAPLVLQICNAISKHRATRAQNRYIRRMTDRSPVTRKEGQTAGLRGVRVDRRGGGTLRARPPSPQAPHPRCGGGGRGALCSGSIAPKEALVFLPLLRFGGGGRGVGVD